MNAIKYRPDIDGLRAIAVLMVVLFHADIKPFAGGFVGVDIFFVISGFLITSLIQKDLAQGTFSFAGFWERRLRRILPGLFAVVLTVFAAGWVVFMPKDFAGVGYQVAAQSIAASNFYFEAIRGYFDTKEEIKPLLHTWSLSVEEQFYFVFPVIMFLLWRFARVRLVLACWIIAIVSFLFSAWTVFDDLEKTFFFLPFRAWELMMGALLALHTSPKTIGPKAMNIAGVVGLLLVLGSGIFYSSKLTFPGAAALPPCLGAALIIWSGRDHATFVARLLSCKACVFVGLISYSFYLWHWPILSFGKYVLQGNFDKEEKIICVVISFILAWLSWKYIEKPFRRPGGVLKTRRALFIAAFAALATMGAGGYYVLSTDGVPARFSPTVLQYAEKEISPFRKACARTKYERIAADDLCQTNPESGVTPNFILWGDSQADAITPAFVTMSQAHHKNGYFAFKHGCPPIMGIDSPDSGGSKHSCSDFNNEVWKFVQRHKIKNVFLVANWGGWLNNKTMFFEDESWYPAYAEKFENMRLAGTQRTIGMLLENGIKIHILLNNPAMRFDPPRALALYEQMGLDKDTLFMPVEKYVKGRKKNVDAFVAANAANKNIIFVDPLPAICPDGKCMAEANGRSLYADEGHYSAYGANHIREIFKPFFKDLD